MVLTDANARFAPHQLQGDLVFTNVDADINQQHFTIAESQLAIPGYPYDVLDDRPDHQFIFSESIWGPAIDKTDGSMVFFVALDAANQHCNNRINRHQFHSNHVGKNKSKHNRPYHHLCPPRRPDPAAQPRSPGRPRHPEPLKLLLYNQKRKNSLNPSAASSASVIGWRPPRVARRRNS